MKKQLLISLLKEKQVTIGAVESMTGGLFSKTLTDIPGISQFFKGALVVYQEETKKNLLGLSEKLLEEFGVVSKEVVRELAKKGQKQLNVQLCIAVSGNAGPSVEKDQKKVGEVYYAIAYLDEVYSYELKLKGSRKHIRTLATKKMIESIISILG